MTAETPGTPLNPEEEAIRARAAMWSEDFYLRRGAPEVPDTTTDARRDRATLLATLDRERRERVDPDLRDGCRHVSVRCVDCGEGMTAGTPQQGAKRVGQIINEHYRARLAADPTGPRVHECGSYCGADIAARLGEVQ